MKFLPLLWSNLKRKKIRTAFTLLSIVVAFVLFGYLAAINMAFSFGIDVADAKRLVTIHKTSLIMPLPFRYQEKIARVPGVSLVTHATWFGGIYQDASRNFQSIFQAPVEPAAYMALYPEFKLPKEQMEAWLADRQGAVVGRRTAERYGWKVGDRVPIQATLWRKKDGSRIWEFDIVGIYDGAEKGTDTTQFLFRYDYFDEARFFGQGIVGWYVLKVDDPSQAQEVAGKIDEMFANSEYETKTQPEKAFAQDFAKQMGDIGAIIRAIVSAVFLGMLLVAGNTMAQSVRERTAELAVLKTLGFTNGGVLALVLAESFLLAVLGGGVGLVLAWVLTSGGDPTGGFLPIFYLPGEDVGIGVGLIVALGFVAGILPAMSAMRLRIVDALRRI